MKISRDKFILLAFVLLFALILPACGPGADSELTPEGEAISGNTPAPAVPPPTGIPPEATLTINGQRQASGIGTYCWPGVEGDVSVCADMIGVPTPLEPLMAEAPFLAAFEFPLADPSELQLLAVPVSPEDELDGPGGENRWWEPKSGEPYPLPTETAPEIELPLDAGLYVLRVFARWEGVGDVLYGFLVEVVADEAEAPEVQVTNVTAVEILQDEVQVLSAADESASQVMTAFRGQTWAVTGSDPSGAWFQLNCGAAEGEDAAECWITADPAAAGPLEPGDPGTIARPAFGVTQVSVLALAGLNLRAGPDISNDVVSILTSGEIVQVTGTTEDGDWWRVRCPDGSVGDCWISADPLLSQPVE